MNDKSTCLAGHVRCYEQLGSPFWGTCGLFHDRHTTQHCIRGTPIGEECKEGDPYLSPEASAEADNRGKIIAEKLAPAMNEGFDRSGFGEQPEKGEVLSTHELNGLYITLEKGSHVPGDIVKRLKETILHWQSHYEAAQCGWNQAISSAESAEAKVKELGGENERLKNALRLFSAEKTGKCWCRNPDDPLDSADVFHDPRCVKTRNALTPKEKS